VTFSFVRRHPISEALKGVLPAVAANCDTDIPSQRVGTPKLQDRHAVPCMNSRIHLQLQGLGEVVLDPLRPATIKLR